MSAIREALREGLPPLPERMQALPVRRGYPVPYFCAWDKGEPDFRLMDDLKFEGACTHHLCWICGGPLGRFVTFATVAISAINRMAAEPPCHDDCAEFAVSTCPFLVLPKAKRRGLEDLALSGTHDESNPGACVLWTTASYQRVALADHVAVQMGDPIRVEWFAEGRRATRDETLSAIERAALFMRERCSAPELDRLVSELIATI